MRAPTGPLPVVHAPLRARRTIRSRWAVALRGYPRDFGNPGPIRGAIHRRSTTEGRAHVRDVASRGSGGSLGGAPRVQVDGARRPELRHRSRPTGRGPPPGGGSPRCPRAGKRNAQRNRRFLTDPSSPMQAREPTCRCKHRRDQQVFEAPLGKTKCIRRVHPTERDLSTTFEVRSPFSTSPSTPRPRTGSTAERDGVQRRLSRRQRKAPASTEGERTRLGA
jgi:hypothetical protein